MYTWSLCLREGRCQRVHGLRLRVGLLRRQGRVTDFSIQILLICTNKAVTLKVIVLRNVSHPHSPLLPFDMVLLEEKLNNNESKVEDVAVSEGKNGTTKKAALITTTEDQSVAKGRYLVDDEGSSFGLLFLVQSHGGLWSLCWDLNGERE